MSEKLPRVPLGNVIQQRKEFIYIDDEKSYKRCRVQLHAQGIVLRDVISGAEIKTKQQQVCRSGEFLVAEIDAKVGGFGIIPRELDGAIVSSHYFLFMVDESVLDRRYLDFFIRTANFREQVAAQGTTNYAAIRPSHVLGYNIPLPPLHEQRRIVARLEELAGKIEEARGLRREVVETVGTIPQKAASDILVGLKCATRPLGAIVHKRTGVAYRSEDFSENDGIPVVRLKEISTKSPTIFLRNPDRYPNVWLEQGDIILAKTSFSTGAMCIWPGPPAVLNQNAIMLRAKEGLDQEFLFTWLGHQVANFLEQQLADPDFYPYIREKDLIAWPIAVPPLHDQRRIVGYLQGLQTKLNEVTRLQAESAAELDVLLPSVLDKALKGEL